MRERECTQLERGRERERERERGREGERESQAGSTPSAQSPTMGLDFTNGEIMM